MGQKCDKPSGSRFPRNFSRYPASFLHCRGPGLLEELDSETRDILPKCFEGAHIKVRKKVSPTLNIGYNLIFSTVNPSGGQIVGDYKTKRVDVQLNVSPYGTFALDSKFQITPSVSLGLDTQLQKYKHSAGTCTLKYSKFKTTTALGVSACTMPCEKVTQHEADVFEKLEVKNNIMMMVRLQCVRKIHRSLVIGGSYGIGQGLQIGAASSLRRGKVGMLVDLQGVRGFWWRRLAGRLTLGGNMAACWDGTGAIARVGLNWSGPHVIVRASCGTDGLVGCTVRNTLIQTEDTHFALLVSGLFNHHNSKFRLGLGVEGYF